MPAYFPPRRHAFLALKGDAKAGGRGECVYGESSVQNEFVFDYAG
jgi:hypothetical protein